MKQEDTEPLGICCSFCGKSADSVSKIFSTPRDYPRAYICDECVFVCTSVLEDGEVRHSVAPPEPAGQRQLQLKQVLLANKIELAIAMFENDTTSIVSTIILNRRADGSADVSVNASSR